MSDFNHILNWKLQAGSHEFPGPNGGTCINEAAIVAAGFEYRKVRSHADCPPCFCPVLAAFAIIVNDGSDDDQRQVLMPLVTRLAGSKDHEDWVERARAEFIMRELDRDVFEIVDKYGHHYEKARIYNVRTDKFDGLDVIHRLRLEASEMVQSRPALSMSAFGQALEGLCMFMREMGSLRYMQPMALEDFNPSSMTAEATFTTSEISPQIVWKAAALALTRAFRIGTQAPVADTAKVIERMEAAKTMATA